MTVKELREKIEGLTVELRGAIDASDLELAKSKKEELRQAKELLVMAEEVEAEEKRALEVEAEKIEEKEERKVDNNMEERKITQEMEYRALVKSMLGERLSEDEQRTITDGNFNSNTGAIIPQQFIAKVDQLRDGYKSLKSYTDVIPVTSDNGKMPVNDVTGQLADLEEDTEMVEEMLSVGEIDFKVADYGKLMKVGNNLLRDSAVSFIDGILAPNFAEASINTENAKIVKVVDGIASTKAVADVSTAITELEKAIAKMTPNQRRNAVIITNNEGYAELDALVQTDSQRARISMVGDTLYFKNKEVIEIDGALLPSLGGKTVVFYVVNLKNVKFFDRQTIEISQSTEAGFTRNKTLIKAIERFDVKANPSVKAKAVKITA